MKIKCDICDKISEYETDKEAWLNGWDVTVVAGCHVTTCSECPDTIDKPNENISST